MNRYLSISKNFIRLLFLSATLLTTNIAAAEKPEVDEALRKVLKEAIESSPGFTDRFDAEVWLVDMSGRLERWINDKKDRIDLLKHLHLEATRAKLDPELVLAVIQVESNFDKFAISRVGARGLMQIMPFWLEEIGREGDDLFDIPTNLRFGCTILRYYLDMEKGNLTRALARYNGSLGRYTYPRKVYNSRNKYWYLM